MIPSTSSTRGSQKITERARSSAFLPRQVIPPRNNQPTLPQKVCPQTDISWLESAGDDVFFGFRFRDHGSWRHEAFEGLHGTAFSAEVPHLGVAALVGAPGHDGETLRHLILFVACAIGVGEHPPV